jgi:hypothetical protein
MNDLRTRLLEIQDYWLKESRTRAAESLRNVFNRLVKLMYVEPGQFVLEFLQNAEDALMENERERQERNERGYLMIELYKDKVVIANNGKPIDEHDLEALCAIKSSKKPAMGYKGFIGIGWKSVYKVSSHVEVYSRNISFEFNKDYWNTPEGRITLEKYGLKPEEVLWQVTPREIGSTEYIDGTKFVIHIDESKYNDIARVVDELEPSLFLFLNYVNEIRIRDYVRKISKVIFWNVQSKGEFEGTKISHVTVNSDINSSKTFDVFLVLKRDCDVPDDVKRDPITVDAERSDVVRREIAIAFYLDSSTNRLKPIEGTKFWGMYSFLPLYEVRTGLKFLIQGDFIVHPGRRYINIEAKWNHWLMSCVADLVKKAIKYLQRNYRTSYLSVFDYQYIGDEVFEKLIKQYVIKAIDEELGDPPVICIKGHDVRLSSVVKVTDNVRELIRDGLFDEDDLRHIYGVNKHILDSNVELRSRDKVITLDLMDLLNENLIKAKLSEGGSKAALFLSKIYKLLYSRKDSVLDNKRFVITLAENIKLARDTYLLRFSQDIENLRENFSEIDEYLKSLDFVDERFAKLVGDDILKWLGVKEVNLRELVEKVILKQLYVDSQKPDRGKLLSATVLVKKSGVALDGSRPIWVITKNGDVDSSGNVWYPELFKGFDDLVKKLGVKLLDIDGYLKYDSDTEGWRKFFSPVIKGLKLYEEQCGYYSGCICTLLKDIVNLVEKVKDILDRTKDFDENAKLVRFLKQLYEKGPENCWRPIAVKLLCITDNSEIFEDSNKCYLHDYYKPEEMWFKWMRGGFLIGPFVSPRYVEKEQETDSWHKFFVKVLGVKEKADKSEIIGNFAEWYVKRILREKYKYDIISEHEGGCDFKTRVSNDTICVEVKGRRENIDNLDVDLNENEAKAALHYGDKYWLIVVSNIPNDPRAWLIKNPMQLISGVKIAGKQIKDRSEWIGEKLDEQ